MGVYVATDRYSGGWTDPRGVFGTGASFAFQRFLVDTLNNRMTYEDVQLARQAGAMFDEIPRSKR
jgi:hypothetical protein